MLPKRNLRFLAALVLLTPAGSFAREAGGVADPAFTNVPELTGGFRLLYEQKFPEARATFLDWQSRHADEPFGAVAVAASCLFEEFYRQGVLTSDFFLDDKRFLHGIEGKPDDARMNRFRTALEQARALAKRQLQADPKDAEALFALTLAAGMESDADAVLEKKHLDSLKRMKEANGYAKELLTERPDAQDAYVALGAANYIIGSLNRAFRLALRFGGIRGDKKLGMQQLTRTAMEGRYLRPFAKILLALAARREKQDLLAQRLLRELHQEFPASPLFAAEYAKAMGWPIPARMLGSAQHSPPQ